jgi:hypothetical protein
MSLTAFQQLWLGFFQDGNSYGQYQGFDQELRDIVAYFNSEEYLSAPKIWDAVTNSTTTLDTRSEPFVHYFSTKGIMQRKITHLSHIPCPGLAQTGRTSVALGVEATTPEGDVVL